MSDGTTRENDVRLPDNAFRPLQPGETYEPVIPAARSVLSIGPRVSSTTARARPSAS